VRACLQPRPSPDQRRPSAAATIGSRLSVVAPAARSASARIVSRTLGALSSPRCCASSVLQTTADPILIRLLCRWAIRVAEQLRHHVVRRLAARLGDSFEAARVFALDADEDS
jgi:hypothetical protein